MGTAAMLAAMKQFTNLVYHLHLQTPKDPVEGGDIEDSVEELSDVNVR